MGAISRNGLLALPVIAGLISSAAALPQLSSRHDTYQSQGCFSEPPSHEGRALKGPSHHADDMSTAQCSSFCADYKYFGTEFGRECFCGNEIAPNANSAEGECTKPCAGAHHETCGDADRLNIWLNTAYQAPAVATVTGYTYKGCHEEPVSGGRALPDKIYNQDDMTPQVCADLCSADGFLYAGVEWGRECFCANTIHGGKLVDESECTKLCAGDKHSFCGEGQRLTLYGPETVEAAEVEGWNYVGCAVDSGSERVLVGEQTTRGDMTAESCASICSDYEFFGVEFGIECYCGRSFSAETVSEDQCTLPCAGDGLSLCGADGRISVYSSANVASNKDEVADFVYLQCAVDSVQARALSGAFSGEAGMTIEKCAEFCGEFSYFGLEFGKECFCGNDFTAAEAAAEECHSHCEGDASELCGGRDRLSVYGSGTPGGNQLPQYTRA